MKILANDGIDEAGKALLEKKGFTVITEKIPQDRLTVGIKGFDGIIVRSATKVTEEIINTSDKLSIIGRAGVGTDNIDKEAAAAKGIKVINTPAASSVSVAELVFAHLFGMVRFLQDSNRQMPENGINDFKKLKNKYAAGTELKGKTLGIIGFGRIGHETAKIAIGAGMNVLAFDVYPFDNKLPLTFHPNLILPPLTVHIKNSSLTEVLENSDFISLHVPKTATPLIGEHEINMMKDGVGIVNCARGGVIDEIALYLALKSGKVAFAGLDVFENEPPIDDKLLKLPNVSLSPHIGASTNEAQERIGIELAEQIIHHFKSGSIA
jgi:D-3-phosphoglycerate dehydrogenase / 2-oxoglutarate reductase